LAAYISGLEVHATTPTIVDLQARPGEWRLTDNAEGLVIPLFSSTYVAAALTDWRGLGVA
jgi:hypothetical protein